jgi:hypothetical protein
VVESALNHSDLFVGDTCQFSIFGQILPYQTVGVFIESSFPGVIRIGEIAVLKIIEAIEDCSR